MRIVIRTPDPRRARAMQERLTACGFEACALVGPAGSRPPPAGEDVALIDAAGSHLPFAAAEAERLRLDAKRPPAIVACRRLASPPPPDSAPFDAALALDAPVKIIARRLEMLFRAGIEAQELRARRITLASLDMPVPATATMSAPARLRTLFVGPPAPFFLKLERALAARATDLFASLTSFAAFNHLHETAFDALVLNAAEDSAPALTLCGALRRNTALAHLPTAIVAAPGDSGVVRAASARGAALIFESDKPADHGADWLLHYVRGEQVRAAASAMLAETRQCAGESPAGFFPSDFFDAHVRRAVSSAAERDEPLSIVVLRPQAPNKKFSGDFLALAAHAMRGADVGCLTAPDALAIMLPCTDIDEAEALAQRTAAFGDPDAEPVIARAVELLAGESGPGLLARAWRSLDNGDESSVALGGT